MSSKKLFLVLTALVCLQTSRAGLLLDKLNGDLKAVPKTKTSILELVGNHFRPMMPMIPDGMAIIGGSIKNMIKRPSDILNDVHKNIKDVELDLKKLPEIISTHSVFKKDNETLNCLGLPIRSFAKPLEVMITQKTKAEDVKFQFATREHPEYTIVNLGEFDLEKTDFNVSRPTILVSHGFLNNGRLPWLRDMKDALLKLDDVNVIIVDWQRGSNTWNYYAASLSTRIVGLQIAKLFAKIQEKVDSQPGAPDVETWGPIYFIGHSLGSHIVGHAAHLIKLSQEVLEKKWIVQRITGMDPAQPCFKEVDLSLKLDKEDAPFVDIIHSNTGFLMHLGFGLPDELGHIDFYPNGGNVQPGCSDVDTTIFNAMLLPVDIMTETICSHGRSYLFMTEAILNAATGTCPFVAYKWDRANKHVYGEMCDIGKCAEMGVNAINYYPAQNGSYFVPTSNSSPFCKPREGRSEPFFEVYTSPNVLSKIVKGIRNKSM